MATYLELKQAAANYLNIAIADLTQNGQDLWILASNQARKMAELSNDFEFSRKIVSITVNGITGGSLVLAQDSESNLSEVKTVIEVGLLNNSGNLCPVEWTTVAESLTRQREDNSYAYPRYPTDAYSSDTPFGGTRFTFSGNKVTKWPRVSETDTTDYPLYLEAYTFYPDWTVSDLSPGTVIVTGTLSPDATGTYDESGEYTGAPLYIREDIGYILFFTGGNWTLQAFAGGLIPQVNSWNRTTTSLVPTGTYTAGGTNTGTATVTATQTATSDIWTTHGQKFLLWASIVQLNHLWKRFVPRTEGNLAPPQQLADDGLASLIAWDAYRYEGFRTHNR